MPDYSYLKVLIYIVLVVVMSYLLIIELNNNKQLHESGFVTIKPPYYGRARPEDIVEEFRTDQM